MSRVNVGNIAVDVVDKHLAVNRIASLVESRKGGKVFTPNVDHVVMANQDKRFAEAYSRADVCLADGMPIVWASRFLGNRLPERVAGSDVITPLLAVAAQFGYRVYFLGASDDVARLAAEKMKESYPSLNIVGTYSPMVSKAVTDEEVSDIMSVVKKDSPELVIVAFGAPKQELFIDKALHYYSGAVMLGLGASLDFLAGNVKRAPVWMRNSGMEWLWRLGQEPTRLWKRYLRGFQFPLIVANQLLTKADS